MADTTTTNLELVKPELDAADVWGGKLNSNFDAIDKMAVTQITFVVDGGGSAVSTGAKAWARVPFNAEILDSELTADQSATAVLDVWKDTGANFPPTVEDTITASAKPSLSASTRSQDSTLTGWTKSISAGDILRVNVDSNDNAQRLILVLKIKHTGV